MKYPYDWLSQLISQYLPSLQLSYLSNENLFVKIPKKSKFTELKYLHELQKWVCAQVVITTYIVYFLCGYFLPSHPVGIRKIPILFFNFISTWQLLEQCSECSQSMKSFPHLPMQRIGRRYVRTQHPDKIISLEAGKHVFSSSPFRLKQFSMTYL